MYEQIVPTKRKYSSIRRYNSKKPKKLGFKSLFRAGSSGLMCNFHFYGGKGDNCGNEKYQHLPKSSQVIAKLYVDLPGHIKHDVFLDNWFSSHDLLLYLKKEGTLAVGTMRANRLQGCPLQSRKTLSKAGLETVDYQCDANSGLVVLK